MPSRQVHATAPGPPAGRPNRLFRPGRREQFAVPARSSVRSWRFRGQKHTLSAKGASEVLRTRGTSALRWRLLCASGASGEAEPERPIIRRRLRSAYRIPSRVCLVAWAKPDAPVAVRGEFQPIATRTPAITICEHLPRLACRTDRFSLVRSVDPRSFESHSGDPETPCSSNLALTYSANSNWASPIGAEIRPRRSPAGSRIPRDRRSATWAGIMPPDHHARCFLQEGSPPGPAARAPAGIDSVAVREFFYAGISQMSVDLIVRDLARVS